MKKSNILVKVNNRGKIQVVYLSLECTDKSFKIFRRTGQRNSKMIDHAVIEKFEGKAKRTLEEQAELEYNSNLKKYLNKGYKDYKTISDEDFEKVSDSFLKENIGEVVTDTNNVPKPMKAIMSSKISIKSFEKDWLCSRKLDGVRCMIFKRDGVIRTASRGGLNYDVSTKHIRENPDVIKFFEKNPDVILDGELYHHGISLQRLSGIAKLKTWSNRCLILEYWIYDYVSKDVFSKRHEQLMEWKEQYPEMTIIDHTLKNGWTDIKREHDRYCSEGFEGLVMRSPKKEYGPDKRSAMYMVKLKEYQDDEFEVVGYNEGFRPIVDMCFTCITKDGKKFDAKPIGDKILKQYYIDNMNDLIGKKGTVKFFNYSDSGVPTQPTFKCFRDRGE